MSWWFTETQVELSREKRRKTEFGGFHLMAAASFLTDIKWRYPGLYFATLSAETQTLSGLQGLALLQLSHLILHQYVLTHSLQGRASMPNAVHPDTVCVFSEETSLLQLQFHLLFMFFLFLCIIAVANSKENKKKKQQHWPGNNYLTVWSMFVCFWKCVHICFCAFACAIYECGSWQFTSLGSVLIRRSQCYLSVLAAISLSLRNPQITASSHEWDSSCFLHHNLKYWLKKFNSDALQPLQADKRGSTEGLEDL